MDNWARDRWAWKRAVRRDGRLSDGAKVLAAALCDDFAHHETAYCAPGVAALAEALGKQPRAILYALAELRKHSWLRVDERRGRGHFSEFHFLKGDGTAQFGDERKVQHIADVATKNVQEVAPIAGEKVQVTAANSASYGSSPCTPYKDKPNLNQKARATSERPAPQCRACIQAGSDNEAAWDEWLAQRRFATLRELGQPSSDAHGRGWDAPFRMPPRPDNAIEVSIAEKWANWATFRMMERRSA